MNAAGVEIVVTLTPFYSRLKDIQSETPVKRVIATSIKEYLPPLLRVLFTLFKEKKGGHRIELEPGDQWFQDCLGHRTDRSADLQAGPAPDDPAIMLMSGGTTGVPKAVVGPHRCLVAAGMQLATWLQPPKNAPQDIALVPLPLFHVYACVGVQSHSIVSRTPMALVPNPRDIGDLLKTIATVRPTLFSAVPALFIALLNHPKVKNKSVDFSSIRACFSGAAPLMAATKTQFEELTGGRIVEGYSLTEAMMACVVNPLNGVNKSGSVGVPLAGRRGRDRRHGVRYPFPAGRRNGRDRSARTAADDRVFQRRRGDGSSAARSSRRVWQWRGRTVASHRRSRISRRGLVPVHRRSPEGFDQDERLSGVAA